MLDPDIQIGKVGNMLDEKWTTEYVFKIHDLDIKKWDFRDSTCSGVVGWIGVLGGTACRSGAHSWKLK